MKYIKIQIDNEVTSLNIELRDSTKHKLSDVVQVIIKDNLYYRLEREVWNEAVMCVYNNVFNTSKK